MFLFLIFFLNIFLIVKADCPYGSIPSLSDPTKCYFYVTQKMNFMAADQYCLGLGGNLVSIHNMFDNVFISGEASTFFTDSASSDFWIGANNLYKPGVWTWMDNCPWDFTDWDKGQPLNISGNNCGAAKIQGGQWIAEGCFEAKPFVCLKTIASTTSVSLTTTKVLTTTASKRKSCPDSWTFYELTGSCYNVLSNSNWLDAENMCKVDGAHLTSIDSFEEAAFVANLAYWSGADCNWGNHAWIGLFTDNNGQSWKWTDGTPFDYPNWAVNQPDNPGTENCGEIMLSSCPSHFQTDQFNNWPCSNKLAKFVCKIKLY